MKKAIALISFSFLLYSSSGFATYYGCDYKIQTAYNFSKFAYNKTVQAVTAHTGILVSYASGRDEAREVWRSVTDVELAPALSGNHFYGSAKMIVSQGGGDGTFQKIIAPVVQYWVTFTDGSTLITETYKMERNVNGSHIQETEALAGQGCPYQKLDF